MDNNGAKGQQQGAPENCGFFFNPLQAIPRLVNAGRYLPSCQNIRSVQSTPIDCISVQSTPIDSLCIQSTPIDCISLQSTSIDCFSVQSTPITSV